MSKYEELISKLKEIFQIDRPELDFGIYRILNARAKDVNEYLDNKLKAKVNESLATAGSANLEHLRKELADAIKNAESLGVQSDNVPKVQELKKRITELQSGTAEHENAVFSHLLTFFSRYYDNGDFISQRRYKGDTYAIPYSGEEVVLHWANKDQYYTKSGENFSNYSFKLDNKRIVHFRLIAADTAKDNRKDNDKERRFVLAEARTIVRMDDDGEEYEDTIIPVAEVNGELIINFEYKPMPKGSKQDVLVVDAVKDILGSDAVKSRWLDLVRREPTEKNPGRTLLEKHLGNYTTKNTADYFIHKDLGRFLRGELDFYIKSEVMNLDDVQNAEKFADIEKNLRMIQCLRAIALDLITFLAQLENFQKKLWLKKKFVVAAHYCVTLDRVPEELYIEIAGNKRQWDQWESLGMLPTTANKGDDILELALEASVGTVDYLKTNKFLMVDTALFGAEFKTKLLSSIDNLDEAVDGVLIHGDNFQALELLQKRYWEQVKCVYIDPPYNTAASEIAYKNSYKHSTWLTMLENSFPLCKKLLHCEYGVLCCTIDDYEFKLLSQSIENNFEEIAGTVSIRIKPSGRPIPNGFALSHEYAIFAKRNIQFAIARLAHSNEQIARYRDKDDNGCYFWEMFRKAGSNSNRRDRPTMYYPIYFHSEKNSLRLPKMMFDEKKQCYIIEEQLTIGEIEIFPIKDDDTEGRWYFGLERTKTIINELKAELQENKKYHIYYRRRPNEGTQPTTHWSDSKYSATEHGTALLKGLFGIQEIFSYPKSIHAVVDCLCVTGVQDLKSALILDYFAGSGTTAQAVISLNRQDDGERKYILVEQGEYFDTVTKPRVQKVVYSADWKDGKPTSPNTGISHAFKVIKLESYEDTLNNMELQRNEEQQSLLSSLPESVNEDYLLRYMLDIESAGSLLSVNDFKKPFDFKLKVAIDSAGATEERAVDLVETFNYLIGLRVKSINAQYDKGRVIIEGTLPNGDKALILWRDCETVNYDELNRFCESRKINPKDSEFDVVYINGDHNIPNVLQTTEAEGGITKTLKLRQIEPEFLSRMFCEAM